MKKWCFLLYVCILSIWLVSCGVGDLSDKESDPEELQSSESAIKGTNYVMATCTNKKCVVLYDLDLYDGENLDNCEIWSFAPASTEAYEGGGGISGVKYREDTVFGDVVIVCAGNGYAAIVSYPDGETLWETLDSGSNSHAIEILPSGNVAVAASSGNTLRLFASSAVLQNDTEKASVYKEYFLKDGHGVLWDPEYKVLWAVGQKDLNAYTVAGEGSDEELILRDDLGTLKPGLYGHDLSADFLDANYLWVTGGSHVYHFNKETGELSLDYEFGDKLDKPSVKGFGNNPDGSYFLTMPNYGVGTSWEKESYAGWSTDKIFCFYPGEDGAELETVKCKSETRAFYKVFSFYGKYQ